MAYNTRRYIKHIDRYDVTHRIEIQQDGFSGGESSMDASGQDGIFTFEHEEFADTGDILKIYQNPLQKGSLEVFPLINNDTDFQLLEDIFSADEDEFRLVWKQDGSIFWTGSVLPDLLEYPEDNYPFSATITAKDFSRLEGSDYTLSDNRQTLITTIANLLDNLGYGLDIQTATSWTEENVTSAQGNENYDFLNQIYHETKALREFARTGDETDQPITQYEALEKLCRNFGLILRQEGNKFKIHQLTAYSDPTDVLLAVYDSAGSQTQAPTSTDVSEDAPANDIVVTSQSVTRQYPALKKVRNKYHHRSSVSYLKLPQNVYISGQGTESYSQDFIVGDDQQINMSMAITALHSTNESGAYVDIMVRVGQYYWNGSSWTTTTSDRVRKSLTATGLQTSDGEYIYNNNAVNISTNDIPSDANTPMEVQFENVVIEASPDVVADSSRFENITFSITNIQDSEANSAALVYQLTQTGDYSETYNINDTWFGDGPTVTAPGALRFSAATADITSATWRRRGQTISYRNFHENLESESLDLQRTPIKNTDAKTVGEYNPEKVLVYRSANYFYMGGAFDGYNGEWEPSIVEISIKTGSDTFETLIDAVGDTATGGGSTGGPTVDTDDFDDKYFEESKNLSEGDPATIRSNIGTEIGTDVQAFSSTLQDLSDNLTSSASELNILDGATLSTAELNLLDDVTATTAELNQLDGNDFTSGITGTTADFSGSLDADTLRTDTGKFLSPTSYQFRNAGDTGFRDVQASAFIGEESDTSSGVMDTIAYRFSESRGWGYNEVDDRVFYNASGSTPFWVDTGNATFNVPLKVNGMSDISGLLTAGDSLHIQGDANFPSSGEGLEFVFVQDDNYQRNAGDGVSVWQSYDRDNSAWRDIDIRGNDIRIRPEGSNGVLVDGLLTAPTIETDTLRTTLFKPNSISGMGGEFVFNGTTSVVSIDTGADTIVVEHAVFSNGDAVIVSSAAFDTGGFSNVELDLTSSGSAVSGGTQYDYTVNSGSDTDIEAGDTAVKVDGNLIYVNANEGDTNAPFLEGYSNVSGFSDSPLSGATATPNWYIRNNEISVGNVFSADGDADTGTLAGLDFDSGALATGDGSLGSYTAGTVTGLQPRSSGSTRVFFGGADDKAGTNATFYATAEGKLFYDAMGGSLSARFREADFGTNNTAPSIDDNEWETDINRTGTDSGENRDTIIRGRYRHRFGINEVTLQCYAKRNINITSGVWDREHRVYLSVWDIEGGTKIAEDSVLIDFNTYQEFTLTLDISSLTVNNYYVIEVENYVFIDGDPANGGSDSATAETFLREDYFIDIGTG